MPCMPGADLMWQRMNLNWEICHFKAITSRAFSFLRIQRSTAGVLAMVVLVGMGERMAERFLPVYILAL